MKMKRSLWITPLFIVVLLYSSYVIIQEQAKKIINAGLSNAFKQIPPSKIKRTLTVDEDKAYTTKAPVLDSQVEKTFERIAKKHIWSGGNETISGLGSTLETTATLRKCLGNWIKKYNIKSISDIPCGDCNWQHAIPGIENVNYVGYDVSRFALERAKSKNKNWTFRLLDVTQTAPPKADLVIMRDVIQHLPLRLGKQALDNALRSNSTWLGVSTFPKTSVNTNIKIGRCFYNNVLKPPFELKSPVEVCDNYAGKQDIKIPGMKFYLIKI